MSDDGYDVDDDDDDDGWMDTALEDTALYRYECMQLRKKPGGGEATPKPEKRHHHLRRKTAIALPAQQHCKEHAIKYDSLCRQPTKT
jgi:hypothetical protein